MSLTSEFFKPLPGRAGAALASFGARLPREAAGKKYTGGSVSTASVELDRLPARSSTLLLAFRSSTKHRHLAQDPCPSPF